MRLSLDLSEFLAGAPAAELRTGRGALASCDGARITTLKITRNRAPFRSITLQPWVTLRLGRDRLAMLNFEVRQGNEVLGTGEAAVPLDEGELNWEDPVRLMLDRLPAPGGAPITLRIEMRVEEE